ncbi:error-prone DNA polymerase [Gayadomonas joobiniege]|uniref:error-prone DNA polymerase n=1 Tax=Gayadomonas joobiniege TaxID=1234606 RepID=UPI000382BDA3|nr:error-prone DNA polymerase [Gayadomonas joobiniege]
MPCLPDYAELFCLTNYSFLKSASHPHELVERCTELGYQALAITDECSLAGIVKAYSAVQSQQLNIKLIIGAHFHFSLTTKQNLLIVLLCPNKAAYSELCQLITRCRRRSNKGEYQLLLTDLAELKHCLLLWHIEYWQTELTNAAKKLKQMIKIPVYLSYRRQLTFKDNHLIQQLELLCQNYNWPITVAGFIKMHDKKRRHILDVLTAERLNQPLRELADQLLPNSEQSLLARTTLARLYPYQHLKNSCSIAQKCAFCLSEVSYQYPTELVPKGYTATRWLRHLVRQGMQSRFADGVRFKTLKTLVKELKLIAELKYEYFFLTLHDIVNFAQQANILYQGRGSAANSIVCYCLKITAVDPRQIDVLIERFISKERREPPDIDVDFEHHRREEVYQYIYQKYGRERAALAASIHTFKFKSAFRAAAKALALPAEQIEFLLKNIHRKSELSWQQQLAKLPLDKNSEHYQHLIELTEGLYGFPNFMSQHVGGFVISAGPLHELVPVENAAMPDRTVIQWDKDDLESLGLLKVDILALGMLTAIQQSFALIKQHYQRTLELADITALGDDAKVYQMLQAADSIGVFQIESRAQMSMLPRLKPKCYYDLVIQIAIVRPGPIQGDMVHPYLRRRNGLESVDYPSQATREVLARTLGVPVFQEQVIKLAMVAAGFSGGEADGLRRAMASWKKHGLLQKFRKKLLTGMLARGYQQNYAERIFSQICGFAEYGFPESHSASFAVLAYVSAWLKYYYPAPFYCALLNSQPMGFYPPAQLIADAKRHGITFNPVCINHSERLHTLEKINNENTFAIRLGFNLVRGLSQTAIDTLLQARQQQTFHRLNQLHQLSLAENDLAALASAGALHQLSEHRYQARWQLMDSQASLPLFNQSIAEKTENAGYLIAPDPLANMLEDYAATGLSLHHHPIAWLKQQGSLLNTISAEKLAVQKNKSIIQVAGVVTARQSPGTAAGITFITLEDETGSINVIVWKASVQAQIKAVTQAKLLRVTGTIEISDGVIHIIAGRLQDISHWLQALDTRARDFH